MIELIEYDARDNASGKMIGICVQRENTWWHFFCYT